jgi:uncharacterized membrane protein HdeD (DUF308 family)
MTTPRSVQGPGDEPPGSWSDPGTGTGQPGTGQPGTHRRDRSSLSGFGTDLASAAWPAFLAAGLGCVIVGIILLAWPKETLTIAAILIGAALIVAGILRLVDGFTAHESTGGRRVAGVVVGLIAILLGLFCIRHYHFTIAALAIIVGLFWIIHGISELAVGLFGGRFRGRSITVVSGLLSLAAGFIVLFWPTISLTVLVAVIGAWLIVYGLLAGYLAFRLRGSGSGRSRPDQTASV